MRPISSRRGRTLIHLAGLMVLIPLVQGCSVSYAEKRASPASTGYTAALTPGIQIRDSRASAHPLLAYSRLSDPGGMSHTQLLQAGGQLRYAFTDRQPNGPWAGVEVAYLRVTSIPDGVSMRPSAGGYTYGVIAGYRFRMLDNLPASATVSYARFHRDGFSFGGGPAGPGLDGSLLKLGFEVHYATRLNPRFR